MSWLLRKKAKRSRRQLKTVSVNQPPLAALAAHG
jgi:hypothetical protein